MKSLKIPADSDRLGEIRTIIELQYWHPAGRIFCKEFGCAALPSQNINICQPKFDALFRCEDPNPTWVRRKGMIVELHGVGHFNSSYARLDKFIVWSWLDRGDDLSIRHINVSVWICIEVQLLISDVVA